MATAYGIESNDVSFMHAGRSNDGKTIFVNFANDETKQYSVVTFDTADFMKFLSTLSKNWGK